MKRGEKSAERLVDTNLTCKDKDVSRGGRERGGSELTTDPACAAPEEGAESGEQAEERLKKPAMMKSRSERPDATPKRRRERGREEKEERGGVVSAVKHSAHGSAPACNRSNSNNRNHSNNNNHSSQRFLVAAALYGVRRLVFDARGNRVPT